MLEEQKCRVSAGQVSITLPKKYLDALPYYFYADIELNNIKARDKKFLKNKKNERRRIRWE